MVVIVVIVTVVIVVSVVIVTVVFIVVTVVVLLCPSMMGKWGLYPIWAPTNLAGKPSKVHDSV